MKKVLLAVSSLAMLAMCFVVIADGDTEDHLTADVIKITVNGIVKTGDVVARKGDTISLGWNTHYTGGRWCYTFDSGSGSGGLVNGKPSFAENGEYVITIGHASDDRVVTDPNTFYENSRKVTVVGIKVELIGPDRGAWCVNASPSPSIKQRNYVDTGEGFFQHGAEQTLLLDTTTVGPQNRNSLTFTYHGLTADPVQYSYNILNSTPVVVDSAPFNHPAPSSVPFSGTATHIHFSSSSPVAVIETATLTGVTNYSYGEASLATASSSFCGAPVSLTTSTAYSIGVSGGLTIFGFLDVTAGVTYSFVSSSTASWGGVSGTQTDVDFRVPLKNYQTVISSWGGVTPGPSNTSGSYKYAVAHVTVTKRCCL